MKDIFSTRTEDTYNAEKPISGPSLLLVALLIAATPPVPTQANPRDTRLGPLDPTSWTVLPALGALSIDETSSTEDVIPVVAEEIHLLGYHSGFASIVTDYQNRHINVLWSGTVLQPVREYANRSPFGVKVTFSETARFSRQAVHEGIQRFLSAAILDELGYVGLDVSRDYGSLTILLTGNQLPALHQMADARSLLGAQDVRVKLGESETLAYAGRQSDTSPWKGGGRITTAAGYCTSGFAVLTSGGQVVC